MRKETPETPCTEVELNKQIKFTLTQIRKYRRLGDTVKKILCQQSLEFLYQAKRDIVY